MIIQDMDKIDSIFKFVGTYQNFTFRVGYYRLIDFLIRSTTSTM